MTLDEALAQARPLGVDRLDAQLLLLHALGRSSGERAWLLAHGSDTLDDTSAHRYTALLRRRSQGEPLAYLVGQREFHGLRLQVDARVLDPRPDTETLVDWALELPLPATARVLDLGTGSGAIALALASRRPLWQLSAADRSADALAVARANAQRLNLPVRFRAGDWFGALDAADGPFDLIASNPPYIAEGDPHLGALRHEPRQALVSGADGLDDLRRIVADAPKWLAPGGWLLLEHGYDQAVAVRDLLARHGLHAAQSRKDLAGIERCSGACRAALG